MKLFVKGLAIVFTVVWILFILLDYWVQNPHFRDAIRVFSYPIHVVKLLVLGGLGIAGIMYFRRKFKLRWINGLVIAVLAMVFMVISADDFYQVYFGRMLTSPEKFQLILTLSSVIIPVFLILVACYVLGTTILSYGKFRFLEADAILLSVGVGLLALTLILFLLGTVRVLHAFVLIPILLLILGWGWRKSLFFVRRTLIEPIPTMRAFHIIGFISAYLVFILICMNTLSAVRPLALGYDAMTLYLNLSSLIGDYNGLVKGNLPYNWSLFISLGYLLFDYLPVTMGLCFTASILSLFALYRLSRKWLEPDWSMLVVLLVATMPMTNWLAYLDMKVDLALLFYLLLCTLIFIYWLGVTISKPVEDVAFEAINIPSPPGKKKAAKRGKAKSKTIAVEAPVMPFAPDNRLSKFVSRASPGMQLLALLGVVIGFAIGIKMSALIIVFPLIALLWYAEGGQKAFFAAAALGLFFVIAAGLDDQAGLGKMHLSTSYVQWALLGLGLLLAGFFGAIQRHALVRVIKKSAVVAVFIAIPMLPWIVKNYSESKSFSIDGLTKGRTAQPVINVDDLRQISNSQNPWQ